MNWIYYVPAAWRDCHHVSRSPRGYSFRQVIDTRNDRMGVCVVGDTVRISFAGTKNLRAWGPCSGNMDFFPLEDHGAHNGFADSADLFDWHLKELMRVHSSARLIVVTGVSRGGPMAMHAVLQLREYGVPRDKLLCLTFGSPPPGREPFRDHWLTHGCMLVRLKTPDDLVPTVGTRRMGAMHPVPATIIEAPPWTMCMPRWLGRGLIHHSHTCYQYGVNRLCGIS